MPTKISYISLSLDILFYYLEMVHEFFQTVSEGNKYGTYISTSNLIESHFCYLPFIYSPLILFFTLKIK